MRLRHSASAFAAGLCMAAFAIAAPLQGQVVTNGGFETGDFSGWTELGNTGFVGVNTLLPHSGTYSAYMGNIGTNGYLLQQLLTTQAGHSYDLSFWLKNDFGVPPTAIFNAYWNGALVFASTGGAFDWTNFSSVHVALFPGTQLAFEFRNDPSFWHLDDVSATDLGVVPEPTSIVLFGSGLVGLAGMVRRRRHSL